MIIRSLLVKGYFSDRDLADLMAAFRTVERRQPDEDFLFAIVESDMTMGEAQQVIGENFPRIDGEEPAFATVQLPMQVTCPDGQTRPMIPNLPHLVLDIEQPTLVMMQGIVEIDGRNIRGEAWRKDDGYHFTPIEPSP